MEDNPTPFKGEPNVPHVSEEFFKVYWLGSQVRAGRAACLALLLCSVLCRTEQAAEAVALRCSWLWA